MRLTTLFFALTLGCAPLLAQTRPDSLNTPRYKLPGMRVVADGPSESIGSVEQKTFPDNQAATDMRVSDTLADISGVSITTGAKGLSNLRIRGFDKSQVKVLVDGLPIGGGYFGAVDVHMLPVSELEAVQVLKGPTSSLYGADAMGGVVNLLTRRPDNRSWVRLGSMLRRNNTNRFWASSSRKIADFDYWAFVSRSASDGMMLSDDFAATRTENGGVRNNDDREQWDAQLRLGVNLAQVHRIEAHAGWTRMPEKGIATSIYEPRFRRYTDWKRNQLSLAGTFQTSDNTSLNTSVYWDGYDDTYEEYLNDTYTNPTLHSMLKNNRLGVRLGSDWTPARTLKLTGGYRWEYSNYNRKDNRSYATWTSHWQQHHNLFGQAMWRRGSLSVSAGLGGYLFTQDDPGDWIGHVEPSVGVRLQDASGRALGLAYSRSGKFPALHNLFSESSGNPDLRPEYADKFEATLEAPFILRELSGSLMQTAFYNKVRDQIEELGGTYENVQNIRAWGGESTLRLRWRWAELHAGYARLRYTDDSSIPLLEAPEHSVTLRESFELPYDVKIDFRSRWFGERVSASDSGYHDMPAYWLHDVHMYKDFRTVKLSLGVENFLDTDYQEEYGYPGPGRDFVLSLEVEL